MAVLQFLLKNWDSVALIIVVIGILVYLIKTGQTKILKKIAIRLVTEAEGELGDGTGIFKQASVIEWLYDKIPAVLKVLFTKKDLETLVDAVVQEAKEKWEENGNIQTYIKSRQFREITQLTVAEESDFPVIQKMEAGSVVTLK